jgi:nitroreductase
MDCLHAIKTRRSIRSFKPDPVPAKLVKQLLEAAMFAPTSGNSQPWEFVVIDQPGMLAQVAEANPNSGMAKGAPLGILVCGNLPRHKHPAKWVQDCSAATQNLLLAAHALGLGAVWTAVWDNPARSPIFEKICGLPPEVKPLCFVVIGYADASPDQPNRYLPERIHYIKFGTGWKPA